MKHARIVGIEALILGVEIISCDLRYFSLSLSLSFYFVTVNACNLIFLSLFLLDLNNK